MTNYAMMRSLAAHVINGPTAQQQPAFAWTADSFPGVLREGQPSIFDFEFEAMEAPKDVIVGSRAP